MKASDSSKLEEEYRKLVEGLQESGDFEEDDFMATPGKPSSYLKVTIELLTPLTRTLCSSTGGNFE